MLVDSEVVPICVTVNVSVRRNVLSLTGVGETLGISKENVFSLTLAGVETTLVSTTTVVLLLVATGDGVLLKVILVTL